MRRIGGVVAACALFALSIGFAVVRPDRATAAGPRVVYRINSGTYGALGVLHEDGTASIIAPRQGGFGFSGARWSPDGTKVAAILYRSDEDSCVMVMNADGAALKEVTCGVPGTGVAWSPDGRRLVIVTGNQLSIINVDGSGRRAIPNATEAGEPDWSADGSQILYVHVGQDPFHNGLRVIAPDGSGAKVLLADEQSVQSPRWSPDGTKLVVDRGGNTGGDIAILRTDGSDTGARFGEGVEGDLRQPSWAAGGGQLCFQVIARDLTGAGSPPPGGVFVQNADGSSAPTRLTGEEASDADCFAGVAPAPAVTATTVAQPRTENAPPAEEVIVVDPGRAATKRASDAAHRLGRSSLATALRAPDQVSTDVGLILANIALAVGFVVLVFPAVLFNSTYEAHSDEIWGWFGRGPRKERAPRPAPQRWSAFIVVGALMALVYALVDPKARLDQATALLVVGVAGAAMVDTLFGGAISSAFLNPRTRERGRIRSYPGSLLIGAGGVAVSRAVNFLPGYLYGVVGGFDRKVDANKSDAGAAAALGALGGVVLAVGAWFLFQPVSEAAAKRGARLSTLIVEAVLAAMATLSFQSLLFSMVPIKMLPGAKVWAWNRLVWAGFVAVGAFSILHLFLHPTDSYTGSVVVMLALFAGFGALSIAFWAYFRFRKPKPEAPPPAPVPPPPTARRQRPLRAEPL